MTAIRTKDKLFVTVLLPLALAALYVWGWRTDAAKRLDALAARERTLVTEAAFPQEMQRLDARRKTAERELGEVRKLPPPAAEVRVSPQVSVAEREAEAIAALRAAGLTVSSMTRLDGGDGGAPLRATGACPDPVLRAFAVDGGYPAVKRALETLVARRLAMVAWRISMTAEGRWKLEIWL